MARGKIQIKRIENSTNRQVTYSKRRNGLFKKAAELTVLCDAKVSLIMFSSTDRFHEYISPSTTVKQLFDQYQKTLGIDLWSSHYEEMQEDLKKLKEINRSLRMEIRQRMGESLEDLSVDELLSLDHDVDSSLKLIRERKYRVLTTQTETFKKKVKNGEHRYRNLFHEFVAKQEDPNYGFVDNGVDYDSMIGFSTEDSRALALHLQPNPRSRLHSGTGSDITTYALLE